MIHPILDRMLTAKRLAGVADMRFGDYGQFRAFEDESWLDYSFYTTVPTSSCMTLFHLCQFQFFLSF